MAETQSFETVTLDFDAGVTTLTFDRPEKKNAVNPTMIEEMYAEVMPRLEADAADPDGGTDVLVVTGAGDAFCGGMDLKEYFLDNKDDPAGMAQLYDMVMDWTEALYRFPRVTIAKVNGWCFGGGMALMCACDLAYAAEDATMGLSEVRWGILPAGGATWLPARTIDRRDFLDMSLTGNEYDGERAAEVRLVNRALPADELDAFVDGRAAEIAELNPTTVAFAKEVYQHEVDNDMGFDAAVAYEVARNRQLRTLIDSEDVKALQAFTDKKFKPGLETYSDEDIADYDG